MAIFNIDYFSTLDRGYYSSETMDDSKKAGTFAGTDFPEANSQGTNLTLKEIGTTMAPDTYPIQELQAKIRQGVARLEIGFAGAGKSGFGGRGATPEILGKRERAEFRELAQLNDVKVSTHATFGKQGLSGLTQNGFSEEEAQKTLKEINKAIEFAASATQGGAIVFHTGEWQRPIMDAGVKKEDRFNAPEDKRQFKEYDEEFKKAPIYLADEKTGQITAITRDKKFYFPEEEYDKTTGVNYVKTNSDGTPKIKEYDYEKALHYLKDKHKNDEELKGKTDAEILLYGTYEQNLKRAKGEALRFSEDIDNLKRSLKYIHEQREMEERVWKSTPENERWKLMEKEPLINGVSGEYIPKKDLLERQEKEIRQKLEGYQSNAVSSQEQYEENMKQIKRFKPIEEVGIQRTADTLAKAGMKAMIETQKNRKDLKESIYIAPENLFPDFYGSHADEMIKIVEESRKKMAKLIRTRDGNISEDEAKKRAQEHIKATLDTGHMNQWRQHWKGNPKDFDGWYLEQIKKMVDKKILGHIHLTDNWGYDDEHITPGQGNAPIRETVKILEKAGFKDFIAEVGSFNANTILPDTLAELGSPIYSMGRGITMGKMRHGHFGMTAPGNYIVGGYAPSNDFKLWSEVPLE